jgi:hypothetical protein
MLIPRYLKRLANSSLASIQGVSAVSDFFVIGLAVGFVLLSWLLIVVCDRLAGGKS